MKRFVRESRSFLNGMKEFVIGKGRDLKQKNIFSHVTLIAFFAWVGLGSDGLSSSCYGPEEVYRTLGRHTSLIVLVGLMVVFTILIIGQSYRQIIKLFPGGGGGYIVATKLLSPHFGMVSGCALLVDYVLTITVSVASGMDAIFSFLPPDWLSFKLYASLFGILLLTLLNLRGVKESVFSLMPIFIVFVVLHIIVIVYSFINHSYHLAEVGTQTATDISHTYHSLGFLGMAAIILKAFSMGAGTFTGIEAVSNSLPILKEPKVKTGLRTMRYMTISLAFMAFGLMIAYALFNLKPAEGKTMNAVLVETFVKGWSPSAGWMFLILTLVSEAALLFIAAQTGFLDGPRVMSSMAQDSWFPKRLAVLSDRLVTQNGILFMSIASVIILILTGGKVGLLIVLYSINVFITFALSQLGMVRHWWSHRGKEKGWLTGLLTNGTGLVITLFILGMVTAVKFSEGGWITIIITSSIVFVVMRIKSHYKHVDKLTARFDSRMYDDAEEIITGNRSQHEPEFDNTARTAVICVSGYNGLGIKTFLEVTSDFHEYRNFIFIEVGGVDAGNFKGENELSRLEEYVRENLKKYRQLARSMGYYSESHYAIGTDVADEIKEMSKKIKAQYRDAVFFIGQFIFPRATAFTRMLHNQTQMAIHNRLSHKGYIMVLVPIRFYQHAG